MLCTEVDRHDRLCRTANTVRCTLHHHGDLPKNTVNRKRIGPQILHDLTVKQRDDDPARKVGKEGCKSAGEHLSAFFENLARRNQAKRIAFEQKVTECDKQGDTEKNWGLILKENFRPYRDELIISTKAGYDMWPGPYGDWGSRKYLLASLDQSLQRMGLDYVDIFYHHRMDPETPLEETMGALAHAVTSGKALYVGLSNYDGETLEKASAILTDLRCPFVINQNSYSIFDRTVENNGLKDSSAKLKKGIIAYCPLAQGMLTDRYLHGIPNDSRIKTDGRFLGESSLTPKRLEQIRQLNDLAAERGQKLAEMALSWILRDGITTSVLIGASKPSQILDNINALKNTKYTEEELRKIDEISL